MFMDEIQGLVSSLEGYYELCMCAVDAKFIVLITPNERSPGGGTLGLMWM